MEKFGSLSGADSAQVLNGRMGPIVKFEDGVLFLHSYFLRPLLCQHAYSQLCRLSLDISVSVLGIPVPSVPRNWANFAPHSPQGIFL